MIQIGLPEAIVCGLVFIRLGAEIRGTMNNPRIGNLEKFGTSISSTLIAAGVLGLLWWGGFFQ